MPIFDAVDLRHLRALDAMFQERSVSRAANRLALTQPAISNSLARLRDHFGDELLVRDGPRLVLTPFAESIEEPIRNILLDVHAVTTARPGFAPKEAERRFTLMASDHVAGLVLPSAIRDLGAQSPRSRLTCQIPSAESRAAFGRGEVDLSILPETLLAPGHPHEAILREQWVYVARQGHPLATPDSSAEDLSALPRLEAFLPKPSANAVAHEEDVTVVPVSLIPHVVAETDLVALVPHSFALFHAASATLAVLAPEPRHRPAILHIQWHRRRDTDPASRWFRQLMRENAALAFGSAL